ncbi:hypothetical protein WS66_06465 [Burkholderia sp. LA-2-3-30-S1-D2]|nr:hypothetical protein WS66_06465 [Burkholderia sp. LA-2-3-30-S1-D2]KVE19417.1 hypothetical protein WS66_27990 [Burkholderia sp. LA-2-3-30-S1-D2]
MQDMPVAAPMTAEAGGPAGTLADIMPVRAETGNGQPRHRCSRRKAWRGVARRVQAAAAIARCGFS